MDLLGGVNVDRGMLSNTSVSFSVFNTAQRGATRHGDRGRGPFAEDGRVCVHAKKVLHSDLSVLG